MRKLFVLSIIVLVALGVGGNLLAQDTAMADTVVCDSDLILNLYTAEYYLNFGAVRDELMKNGMQGVDLTKIDKGSYAPAFDAMMGMMDSSMMMEGSMLSGDTLAAVVKAMGMSSEDMMMEMPTGMTMLAPAQIAGEPAECAALRAELSHFYQSLLYVNQQMMMQSS
jgi:hypothetical protein